MVESRVALPATIFAAGLGFFMVWTLGAHLVTLSGLSFPVLYGVLTLALVAGAAGSMLAPRTLQRIFLSDAPLIPAIRIAWIVDAKRLSLALIAVGIFFFALLTEHRHFNALPLWCTALATCAYALWQGRRTPGWLSLAPPAQDGWAVPLSSGTAALALLLLSYYFFCAQPDSDDSLFLNFAAGAKRAAHTVFGADTMLGIPGLPFIKSTYKLESYQLLAAVISALSGLTVMQAAHIIIPFGMCLFGASVLALIHYALFREGWFKTVLIHLALLTALGGGFDSYGMHGISRMFQGKGPFVTFLVPLICLLTACSVRQKSWAALGALCATFVMSLGLTANALFAAPLAVALMGGPLFVFGDRTMRLACCRLMVPILYAAALAAYLLLFDPPYPSEFTRDESVGLVLHDVFYRLWTLAAAVTLIYCGALGGLLNRKFAAVSLYTALVLLVILDPWLTTAFGTYVTGHVNYRLLWAVPVPLAMSVVAGMVVRGGPRWSGALLAFLLLAAVAAPESMLRRVTWGFAGIKVSHDYAVARQLHGLASGASLILAPEEISMWIPTFDDYRPVVEARFIYAPQRSRFMPKQQYDDRSALFAWASQADGAPADDAEIQALLDRVGVALVIVRAGGREAAALASGILRNFRRVCVLDNYEAWERIGSS